MMKRVSFLLLGFSSKAIFGQAPSPSTWLTIQPNLKINDRWEWKNDLSYRTIGMSAAAYQYMYKTGAEYQVNKIWATQSGASFFYTRSSYRKLNHEFGREFRLWQQAETEHSISKTVSIQNRLKTEERWFAATRSRQAYFGFRTCYRLALTKAINDRLEIQLSDEYMQQLEKMKYLFNQNRLMTRLTYKVSRSTEMEGGYMWLKRQNDSQHVLLLTFQKTFVLHGRKNNS